MTLPVGTAAGSALLFYHHPLPPRLPPHQKNKNLASANLSQHLCIQRACVCVRACVRVWLVGGTVRRLAAVGSMYNHDAQSQPSLSPQTWARSKETETKRQTQTHTHTHTDRQTDRSPHRRLLQQTPRLSSSSSTHLPVSSPPNLCFTSSHQRLLLFQDSPKKRDGL